MNRSLSPPVVVRCLAAVVLAGVLVIFSSACNDSPRKHVTIGIVSEVSLHDAVIDGFKAGLADFHYVAGENVTYIYEGASGRRADAVDHDIRKLLDRKVDMLFTTTNLVTLRTKLAVAGTRVPVVFGAVSNPVGEDIVESIPRPGGNLTGVQVGIEVPKALEWLVKVVPDVHTVFLPYNPDDAVSMMFLDQVTEAARQLKIEISHGEVHSVGEAVAAIEALPSDIQAIFRFPSPTLDPENIRLSQAAIQRRLPLVTGHPVDNAVLLSLMSDLHETGRRSARLAYMILQGLNPADLPVETAEIGLLINLETAGQIGMEIPDSILHQATRIVR